MSDPDADGGEDQRLRSLDDRLREAALTQAARTGKTQGASGKGYNQGNRVLAELIGGLAGGAFVGWLLDRLLGTSPWLLLVTLFLGIGLAFRNIIRISAERPE